MLWELNFITIWVSNSIIEFWAENREQKIFVEAKSQWTRMTSYPRGANLRQGSRREEEREHTCKTTSR
jgi:hypothetical protein